MPQTTSASRRVRGGTSRARSAGQGALDRLTQSVDAAQVALKDLRKELSRGSRDMLSDLDTTLKHARKDLRHASKTVAKDLGQIEQALVTGKPAPRRAAPARTRTARASAAKKPATATAARGARARTGARGSA
jgi:hypothetical protein